MTDRFKLSFWNELCDRIHKKSCGGGSELRARSPIAARAE